MIGLLKFNYDYYYEYIQFVNFNPYNYYSHAYHAIYTIEMLKFRFYSSDIIIQRYIDCSDFTRKGIRMCCQKVSSKEVSIMLIFLINIIIDYKMTADRWNADTIVMKS